MKYSLHNSRIHPGSIHFSTHRYYFCSVWFALISTKFDRCTSACLRYHSGYSHSVGPMIVGLLRFLSWSIRNLQHYILHTIKRTKATWIGHMLRRNCLLKHVIEGKIGQKWREEDREDVRRYWMTSRNGEDTGKWRRKH